MRNIYVRHEQLADFLVDGSAYGSLDRALRCEFQALESLLHDLERSREFNLRVQDLLLGFGECFSSRLVTEALCQAGVSAEHVDARECIVTDARHGQASPLWDATNERIQEALTPLLESGRVPVLGGFIASTVDGVSTTLGRGGSDFSAAIVGAALSASRVEIWTDVDGVMTTDPKLCPEARVIPKMSFDEAVAFFQKEGYQSKETAMVETKRGTVDPTYLYYTLGKLEIMKLREDMKKKQGAAFSLEEFHNNFLKQGFPPIKIVREAMLGDDSPTL